MKTSKRTTCSLAATLALLLHAPAPWAAVTPAGDAPDFAHALARDYQDMADSEHAQGDGRDGKRYQQRASDAAAGRAPVPQEVAARAAFLPARHVPELTSARTRLMTALEGGGRERAPHDAARAQSSFDCWLEQASEDLQPAEIAACRQSFLGAVTAVEGSMPASAPIAAAVQPVAPAPVATVSGPYVVQFALDDAGLDADALSLLAQVKRDTAASASTQLHVVGHASRAGSAAHNMRLSQRRADAVKTALLDGGMPEAGIVTDARGESDTLIDTADGVREPRNRRVEITVGP